MTSWRCADLTVDINGASVLRGVTLEGADGSATVVVGPSGAGKTTLLRCLAGLSAPSRGRVLLDGDDVTGVPPHKRGTAVLFQDARLLPGMDAAGNVAFPLQVRGVPGAQRRRRAEELLEAVGLGGMGARAVRSLSGGEQQRVALARALAAAPRLLLLDEPTSAVDPPRRADLRRLLREVNARFGVTAVAVTHDQAEAAELADTLVVLLDGVVAQAGPPRAVFNRPATPAVARFLGGHNVVRVSAHDGWAELGGRRVPLRGEGLIAVAIRPDAVRLDAQGGWRLRVTDVAYCGDYERVELADGPLVLRAHVPAGSAPARGDVVAVDLPAEALWPMPLEGVAVDA